MDNKIVTSPEALKKEGRIKELRVALKKRNTTLKSLKTRLRNTQQKVDDMQRKVQTEILHKMETLDDLRIELSKLAKKLKNAKWLSEEEREGIAEMAEDMATQGLGEDFEAYKAQKKKMEAGEFDYDEHHQAKMQDMFAQFRVKPTEKEQRNIRKVFLNLSVKFHPDKAKNKKEANKFHGLMQQINEAYTANDIHALLELERQYITEELDFAADNMTIDVLQQEIKRLETELEFIENQITRTSSEIKNLRQSGLGEMLTDLSKADRQGEGIDAQSADFDEGITMFKKMRDALKDTLKRKEMSPLFDEMMAEMSPLDSLSAMMDDELLDGISNEQKAELLSALQSGDIGSLMQMISGEVEEGIKNAKFPIGSSVRIKTNKKNPFNKRVSMKDWEGRIIFAHREGEKTVYEVEMDSVTINNMPFTLIQTVVQDYEDDFLNYELYEHQLEAAKPRDTENKTLAAFRKWHHRFAWSSLDKAEAQKMQRILLAHPEKTDGDNWGIYLEKEMDFPFNAKTLGQVGVEKGFALKVLGVKAYHEDYGHIMTLAPNRKRGLIDYPLIDIAPIARKGKNAEILKYYQIWHEDFLAI